MNELIIFCAKYLIVFVVIGLGIAWLRVSTEYKKEFAAAVIIGGIVSLLLSRIGGHLYFDPRPFVSQHVVPLIPHGPDNGFPSDHSLLCAVLTAVTYFYSRKIGAAMFVLTVLVGAARVMAKVHSPIDIVGAWVIGAIGAVIGYYAARWLLAKFSAKKRAEA